MNPAPVLIRGIWHCIAPGQPWSLCGLGYTEDEAYADWWRLTRRMWLEVA
jgi:hypothetical protein